MNVVSEFCYASYGDPLMASHIAIFLLPQNSEEVLLTAWAILKENEMFHVFPSMENWVLGRTAYFTKELPNAFLKEMSKYNLLSLNKFTKESHNNGIYEYCTKHIK